MLTWVSDCKHVLCLLFLGAQPRARKHAHGYALRIPAHPKSSSDDVIQSKIGNLTRREPLDYGINPKLAGDAQSVVHFLKDLLAPLAIHTTTTVPIFQPPRIYSAHMRSPPVFIKQEAAETVVDLPEVGRGESCAKTKRWSSEPPTPTALSPLLTPKVDIKEDPDDPLAYLRALFDGVRLDDFDDDSDTTSEDVPSTPAAKGIDPASLPCLQKRTYFYDMGRLYFFDEARNLFRDNSPGEVTLAAVGKPFMLDNIMGMFDPDFRIDDISYYFDPILGTLQYLDQGTLRNVHTWTGGSDSSMLNASFSPNFVLRTISGGVSQPNSGFPPVTSGFQHDAPDQMPVGSMFYDGAKREAQTPSSLHKSSEGSWSPGSSNFSPIMPASSRASSEELEPLITDQGYDMTVGAQIYMGQKETKHIQKARVAISNKADRLRCPVCGKQCRRPGSLEDHLNVHSGKKPHICPYKGCKTGFAAKSNMKRHLMTHRDGVVKDYGNGRKVGKANPMRTCNSEACQMQRFRLTA